MASHEEQGDTCHTDDGSKDLEGSDPLVEKVPTGQKDEDGGHCHDGLGNACSGVEGRHQGETDTKEGAEKGGKEDEEHATAVASGPNDGAGLAGDEHGEGEAQQSCDCPHEGAGKGHEREGFGRLDKRLVVGHAHFAENEPYALAQSCPDAEKDTLDGDFKIEFVMFTTFGEDAQADAEHGDEHAKDGKGGHSFAKKDETEKGGSRRSQRHEELAEAATDEEIGIEKAMIAQHIADET